MQAPESFASAVGKARLLGGSWVVISGVISPLRWVITIVTLLITPLITTHEPPSIGYRASGLGSIGASGLIIRVWSSRMQNRSRLLYNVMPPGRC